MTNKLSDFGHTFQIKSVSCLMSDSSFIAQIYDILDEKHYDSDSLKWIVKECKSYYDEYKAPITLDVFKVKVQDVHNDILKTTIVETLKEVYRYLEAPDLEFIKDQAIDFFKNQTLKNAIIESVDILEHNGDFDAIKKLVDDAMRAGAERNIGHEYVDDIEIRYSEMARSTVETPWDVINDLTQGGLAGGELGVVVAPAGVGKSWILAAMGAGSMKRGSNVLHYTMELNEAYVGLRYDSIFTGIANQNLKYHKDEVKQKIETIDGELIVKYFPTKTASVNTLSAHLQKLRMMGKEIDMIIVDYADILKDTGNAREVRHALGNIYEDLRGLAGEFQVPVWTASQANRCHILTDKVETENGKIEIGKIKEGDEILTHLGYKKVTKVFPVEKQPVYKVKLKSGKEITISADHDLPIMYGKLKSVSTGLKVGDKLFTKK